VENQIKFAKRYFMIKYKNKDTMKINFWAGLMCALVLSVSCREESDRIISHGTTENEGEYTITRSFAEPDGSVDLSSMSSSSKRLRDLLDKAGSGIIHSLGTINITDEQYEEIAAFTNNLTAKDTTQLMKYRTIFSWITKNITYEFNDNDPYAVFKNRKAICQGYSNLLTVMCYSQGIPTMVVNGFLIDSYYGEM
jgi:transglutaminase-like putative cysteine protease